MLWVQHYVDPFLWASLAPSLRVYVPGLCACLPTTYRDRKPLVWEHFRRWDNTLLTGFHLCSSSLWSEVFSFLMRFFSLLKMQCFLTSPEQIGSPGGKAGLFDASPLHPDSPQPPIQQAMFKMPDKWKEPCNRLWGSQGNKIQTHPWKTVRNKLLPVTCGK